MAAEIFLVAPDDAAPEAFAGTLAGVLDAARVAALYLPRGMRSEADYESFVKALLPVAQNAGTAVLLDNDPALAKKLGADGVHVTGGISTVREALGLMKPGMIVGAGALHSRDDAMNKGEAGADYLFFGELSGTNPPEASEDALWWAKTFEVPAVYCDPAAPPAEADAMDCEFLALGKAVWSAPEGPAKVIAEVARRLGSAK